MTASSMAKPHGKKVNDFDNIINVLLSFLSEFCRSSSVRLNIYLFVRVPVPERIQAHNITYFDCQISLENRPQQ